MKSRKIPRELQLELLFNSGYPRWKDDEIITHFKIAARKTITYSRQLPHSSTNTHKTQQTDTAMANKQQRVSKPTAKPPTPMRQTRLRSRLRDSPVLMRGLDHRGRPMDALTPDPEPIPTRDVRRRLQIRIILHTPASRARAVASRTTQGPPIATPSPSASHEASGPARSHPVIDWPIASSSAQVSQRTSPSEDAAARRAGRRRVVTLKAKKSAKPNARPNSSTGRPEGGPNQDQPGGGSNAT